MRILSITAKCSDMFSGVLSEDGESIGVYDGYVPSWIPNLKVDHYGDYVEMDIDIDSGRILNWRVPTKKELAIFKH